MIRVFKATYQDRALNRSSTEIRTCGWGNAIAVAYELKRADQKLMTLEFIKELDEKEK